MATIRRTISARTDSAGKSEILLRLNINRTTQLRLKSGLYIPPANFDNGSRDSRRAGAFIYPRANQKLVAELRELETALVAREQFLLDLCASTSREQLTKEFVAGAFDDFLHPVSDHQGPAKACTDFYDAFDAFMDRHDISPARNRSYQVLKNQLRHFEAYRAKVTGRAYNITLDGFDEVNDFEHFLRHEHEISAKYPKIYENRKGEPRHTVKPAPKGDNTIVTIIKRLRTFFNWCNDRGLTDNRPVTRYTGVKTERYGRPYYITLEERDKIGAFDLSARPALAVQRDIFVFQCLIGCRVSDLLRLTPANIINGAVEYIPTKTKGERPEVVRVPLHPKALELVKRYAFEVEDGRLFPFISAQKYNDAIRDIFTACELTRKVTVINPTTGEEEQRPLNEIASSHIARRTFIGNLYKQVRDPNLVGTLSGHKEGSRAFVRYRDIDEDMKRDLINLL